MANSQFAQNQLEKHGWTAGSGLGKNEHGIKSAIKANIKQDQTGVGFDAAEEFTFHWWDHVFNKAAKNIDVKHTENGVTVKQNGQFEVSKKKSKTFASKDMLYGRFVKAATLDQGVEESVSKDLSSSEDEEQMVQKTAALSNLSDAELFKVCGGRTAHKGARHGLKANGKLARVAEQEAELLELYQKKLKTENEKKNPVINYCKDKKEEQLTEEEMKTSKKRKKKAKNMCIEDVEVEDGVPRKKKRSNNVAPEISLETKKNKKQKKKKKKLDEKESELDKLEASEISEKKKKKGNVSEAISENVLDAIELSQPETENCESGKKKKKKSKDKEVNNMELDSDHLDKNVKSKKKKKSKK